MPFAFTQNDIEKRISDKIPHGRRREIAREARIGETIVYGWLNPDDERKSPFFTALSLQAAADEIDPQMGEELFQEYCRLRAESLPKRPCPDPLLIDRELGNLSKEFTDVIVAKCEGKSPQEQEREIAELRSQLDRYQDALSGRVN